MKKKLAVILGMLMLAISLCACGADPKTVDYNGKSYDELEQESFTYLLSLSQFSPLREYKAPGMTNEELIYSALQGSGITEANYADAGLSPAIVEGAIKYLDICDEYGVITGFSDEPFAVTVSGNTTTTDSILVFSDESGNTRDVVFEVVYSTWNMEVTGISIDPVLSLGEKMANAGMNTLISICIVFAVLILISLIIYAFNIFPYIEKKRKEKAAQKAPAVEAPVVSEIPVVDTVEETDDLELIAVIAAAIAALEGCSTSDFVVRSINRR